LCASTERVPLADDSTVNGRNPGILEVGRTRDGEENPIAVRPFGSYEDQVMFFTSPNDNADTVPVTIALTR
jgi:hypothetical protein